MIPDINNRSPKIILIISFFFVPCTIMFLCYIHIFVVVKKKVKRLNRKAYSKTIVTNTEKSNTSSSNFKLEVTITKVQHELPNYVPNSEDNGNEIESNRIGIKRYNMSKKIRKHLRSKLSEISCKHWFTTRKDKKLRTIIIAIMICFCISHLPLMVIRNLDLEFSSSLTMVFISYLLFYSNTCLNPVKYVMMSNQYR